jgi:methyl-accepting chemotaxis protein
VIEQEQQKIKIPLRVRLRLSPGQVRVEREQVEEMGDGAGSNGNGTWKQIPVWVEQIAKAASEALEVTSVGQQQVDRANEGMRQVREATLQSARAIKRLSESGQEINETTMELADLATRMNLLALNAAIEAARAGEQARGFVVIAQEIRALSARCTEAARKVAARLRAIQGEVAVASQSVDASIGQVVMQCELITQMGVALDAIGIVTEQMASLARGPEIVSLDAVPVVISREDASSPR